MNNNFRFLNQKSRAINYTCSYSHASMDHGLEKTKEVFIWGKNIPAKRGPHLREISPYKKIILKNQNLLLWKYILPPNSDPTFIKPGSRFGGTFFSHTSVSSRFAGTCLIIKCRCDIFKEWRKAFNETRNKNGSQINDLVEN